MKTFSETLAAQFNRAWIFVIVKPGFENLSYTVVERFAADGWKLRRTKPKQLILSEAKRLYAVHKGEDFYDALCKYMSSDISVGMIFEKDMPMGEQVFKEVGKIKEEIRKEYGESDMRNVLHSSDSLSAMSEESQIYF